MNSSNDSEEDLNNLSQQLTSALFRFNCPEAEDLLNYHWGIIPPEKKSPIAEHLATCPYCSQEIAQFSPIPQSLQPQAKELESRPSLLDTLSVYIGRLIANPALDAVRSPLKHEDALPIARLPQAYYYEIEEVGWSLTLSWLPDSGTLFALQGQLFASDFLQENAIRLELHPLPLLSKEPITTQLDADGIFVLKAIPLGRYELRFLTPIFRIDIPAFDWV